VGKLLYVGSCAGVFYAFDAGTSDVRWKYDAGVDGGTQFHGNPLVIDSIVYFGTDQGSRGQRGVLYAVDRYTGKSIWKFPADPGLPSDICAWDSLIYVMSYADEILAVNRNTGALVWRTATGWTFEPDRLRERINTMPRRTSVPVIGGARLFVPARDSAVICLDAGTGEIIWSAKFPAGISSQVTLIDTLLAFGTTDRAMVYLRCADGSEVRRDSLDVLPLLTMTYAQGKLLFLAGDDDARPRDIFAVYPASGATAWQQSLESDDPDAYWYAPRIHVWNGQVIIGSTDGLIAAFAISDGSPAWTYRLKGQVRGIGHSTDRLFVGTYAGMLYALVFGR
jgi:outer membrane protein assembly factor BamB